MRILIGLIIILVSQSSSLAFKVTSRFEIEGNESEDYEEPVPVKVLTKRQLVDCIIHKLQRSYGGNDLDSKSFDKIGLYIKLDERTIDKKKIPMAYVMVIIGGKQLQKVKTYNPVERKNIDKDDPYILLK